MGIIVADEVLIVGPLRQNSAFISPYSTPRAVES
jgi:hypothetical protein